MSSERGRLIVISGPTASGKSTLWRRLVALPGVRFSVSATTRSPRPGEVDGRDYHFLDDREFDRRLAAGEFLEHAEVHGRRYGTLRAEVERALAAGEDLVLEIDVQGAEQLRGCGLPMVSIFVAPPSEEVLRERLRGRGTESEEEMKRRLAIVRREMDRAGEYDHVVVNDDFERMLAEVLDLLGLEEKA
ncbi:MAG: guanylate kinase [Planctomycetota bacterium]|nr:MAG: guanylate kinase [Planctomycetota bacterium]